MPWAPATEEDRAKTLQLMREVLREFADLRIPAANSVGQMTLEALQMKAEKALAKDDLDNEE